MHELPNITFSLAEQPCVPVLDADAAPQMVSLREALRQAHTLKELHHSSPVVTASLIRLLVAVLLDIFEPHNLSDWQKIWTNSAFDAAKIDAYFQKHAERFDLFHPTYPFYQAAGLEDANPVNLNLFNCAKSGGNNPTLFDHSLDAEETDHSPAEAFHSLLAVQNFALAGLLRRTTTLNGTELYWQSAYSAPLIPGAMVWLTGDTLFETLTLNLVPIERTENEEFDDETPQDKPAWRLDSGAELRDRQSGKTILKEPSRGTRDRLTWQSRLVRLMPEQTESGNVVVRRACFNFGRSADNGQNQYDPMLAYRSGKKEGMLVVRLSPEKAVWRDAQTLLGISQRGLKKLPRVMDNLHTALQRGTPGLDRLRLLRLNVAGLANDQAKILLWRHERLEAPAAVLTDPNKAARIGDLLQEAEDVAGYLRSNTRRLCEIFLSPLSIDPSGKPTEGMKPDPERVSSLSDSIDPRPAYWARLESHFHALLLRFEDDATANSAAEEWRNQVQKHARRAFTESIGRLGDDSIKAQKAAAFINTAFLVPSRQVKKTTSKS